MTDRIPATEAADPLLQALAYIDWRPGSHMRSLAAGAIAAAQQGKKVAAWLLADRLVRIDRGRHAAPFALRASALAQLGDRDAANADIRRGLEIEPDDRLLNEALLGAADQIERRSSAVRLLGLDDEARGAGLAALAQEAVSGVILIDTAGDGLAITLHCREGGSLDLCWSDGSRSGSVSIAAQPDRSSAFGHIGRARLAWPTESPALALSSTVDIVVPTVVRRRAGPGTKALSPESPVKASGRARMPALMIVVPVYDDFDATAACFASLAKALPQGLSCRVVAIDDASPDPAIAALLDRLAAEGRIELLRNPINLGFAASVNRALAQRRPDEDILLLNADTIIPAGAIDRLAAAAWLQPSAGTITPLSNNGEDTSLPLRFQANPLPDQADIERLNALAHALNGSELVAMPNGIGFCLYLRAEVVERTGAFSLSFDRGYYEDVDYCLRAAQLGYGSFCATGIYVGHGGSRSFKAEKRALVRRNLPRLQQSHPAYHEASERFFREDPLRGPIATIEENRLRETGPLACLLVDGDLPDWLIARFAAGMSEGSRRKLVASVWRSPDRAEIVLKALDGGIPQNIRWSFDPQSARLPEAIAEAIGHLPIAELLCIDAHRLCPSVVEAFSAAARRILHAVAAADSLPDNAASEALRMPGLLVATPRYESWLRQQGLSVSAAVEAADPDATPPATADPARLAVLADDMDAGAWPLARAIAMRSAAARGPISLCLLGGPDEELQANGPIFASGRIARSDNATWLTRLGGAACLIASRRYGLADARSASWPRHGCPVAVFDPSVEVPRIRGLSLALPVAMPDEAVAEVILSWLDRLRRPVHVVPPSVIASP